MMILKFIQDSSRAASNYCYIQLIDVSIRQTFMAKSSHNVVETCHEKDFQEHHQMDIINGYGALLNPGTMISLSTLFSSISTTSKRSPRHTNLSPVDGILPRCIMTKPPSV